MNAAEPQGKSTTRRYIPSLKYDCSVVVIRYISSNPLPFPPILCKKPTNQMAEKHSQRLDRRYQPTGFVPKMANGPRVVSPSFFVIGVAN